tara:strand:- start:687 stop:1253 length:567 start_codon:yes stop_codon:yes gene_type:complete
MSEEDKALLPPTVLVQTEQGELLVRDQTAAAMPIAASPAALERALLDYNQVQATLDRMMPGSLIKIQGRKHRKKSYWRAVATAFNLSVTCTDEKHIQSPGGDWGWLCTYRAAAPNGRVADGDGSCFASEKKGGQGTVHNVRAHAHTRSYNRAVSNLVGFGEVSAEEMGAQTSTGAAKAPVSDDDIADF